MASPADTETPGVRAEARRYVLSAAAAVLAENPSASMQEVASASGIGRATMYRWFANRDHLLEAIHAQVLSEASELTARRLEEDGGALEALLRLSRDIVELVGGRYRFLAAHKDKRQREQPVEAELARTMERFIAAGQRAGELRGDLPADWLVTAYGHLMEAAIEYLDERGLERAAVSDVLVRSIKALFAP